MSTDKTLEDVQPGGSVRLPEHDQSFNWKEGVHDEASLRLAWKAWDNLMYEDSAGEYTPEQHDQIGRMLVNVEQMMDTHPFAINEEGRYVAKDAALSAQPSPGGQGDAVVRAINSKDLYQVLMDVQNGIDSPALAGMANGAIRLIDKARAELAARQPVGEPVAVIENGAFGGGGFLCIGPMPPIGTKLYTAQPAQAVDLGKLPRAVELLSNVSRTLVDWAADEQREAIGIVKALIDSQAVGNG